MGIECAYSYVLAYREATSVRLSRLTNGPRIRPETYVSLSRINFTRVRPDMYVSLSRLTNITRVTGWKA